MSYFFSALAGGSKSDSGSVFGWRFIGCVLLLSLFTLSLAAQDAPTITISPESGEVEAALMTIEISGLEAQAMYTVAFVFEGEIVFSSEETSDEDGHIRYQAGSTEGDLPGIYSVQVLRDGEVIVSAEFELTASQGDDLAGAVSVSPTEGPIGTVHAISISELEPLRQYTVAITASETLIVGYRRQHSSDDEGFIEIEVFAEAGDSPGQQAIAVYDENGDLAARGAFMIDAPPERDLSVGVFPLAAPAGGEFEIRLGGLAPFDNVSAEILSADGGLIDTLGARASNAGEARLIFESPTDLALGVYSIVIRETDGDADLASASLEIVVAGAGAPASDALESGEQSGENAETRAPETADRLNSASATIAPQSALIGSVHLITVRDLLPKETVSFDVTFEGRSVYKTEKTADEDGLILLELVTTAGDKAGDYTITVIRESGVQPSVILTATREAVADISPPLVAGGAEVIDGRLVGGSATLGIAAQAGQYLLIEVSSDDFDPAATLYDPFGYAISFSGNDAGIGPLQIAESGEYELEIFPSPSMDSRRVIEGEFVAAAQTVSVSPIAVDSEVAFALSADAPALYYELSVETGDSLTISTNSGGELDTVMQLIAPDGTEFAFDDDGGSGFDAEFSNLIFDRRANYILTLRTFSGYGSGDGALQVRRNPAHALEDGATIIHLNDKVRRDLVLFDAVEGEMLILRLDRIAGDAGDLAVTASMEGMKVMSYSAMGVPDELPLAFVMPMSGRVVVTLEKFGRGDGISLGVSLERPRAATTD